MQPKTLVPALAALKELLKNDLLHDVFVHGAAAADADASSSSSSAEGSSAPSAGRNLAVLAGLLVSQAQNTQVVYEVGFSLWLLSYNASLLHLFREHRVIRALVGVIKSLLRVKVVRVALAALRNLLDKEKCNEAMIDAGLPRLLPVIGARLQQWDDEEIADDARAIEASLSKDIKELSSFEMYEREVMSGELTWSVVHTEKFWRENFQKFDKENFKLVRALVSLLTMKEDKATLEVACFDLGEFARFHPNGKKVIQKIDGKSRLMNRMGHPDAQVAKQALLAVQKLMVNNWEFLSKA
jgi:V-type H+-transporting ATPase subunit H